MESGDHDGSGRISHLPPLEGGSRRERNLTAAENRSSKDFPSMPPPKSQSASLPSLYRKRSLLAHKPILVIFVRNGDRYFEGVKINVTQRNMRSWDALLAELSRRIDLPAGVRNIYTPDGGTRIKSLSQLEHQKTYVCGSTEPFKRINYNNLKNPDWKISNLKVLENERASVFTLPPPLELDSLGTTSVNLDSSSANWMEARPSNKRTRKRTTVSDAPKSLRLLSIDPQPSFSVKCPEESFNQSKRSLSGLNSSTQNSQHKVLNIYRNAPLEKRECVKVYLNKNMINSWEEAKQLVGENLNTINGILRLFDLQGKEIESLSQLWAAKGHLIAAGKEKFSLDGFLRGVQEHDMLDEVHSESSSTVSSSTGRPLPVTSQTHNIVHSSPKRVMLKRYPLPVISETASVSNENFHSEAIPNPESAHNASPNAQESSSEKDDGVVEKLAEFPPATGPEALSKDAEVKHTQLDSEHASEGSLTSSKLNESCKEAKAVQSPEPTAASITSHTLPDDNSMNPQWGNDLVQREAAGQHSTITQDSNQHSSDDDQNEVIPSEATQMMEDKPEMSTSSSDVSLPNRRDSLYVNHHFPPSPSSVELNTPDFGSPTFKTRRRRKRRMSLLQELQNGTLSRQSTSSSLTDFQLSPQKSLPHGLGTLPHTPLSDVSLGAAHTVVDMLLTARDDTSVCSTTEGTPTRVARASRSVAIQTNYIDEELHTTMETELVEQDSHSDTECLNTRRKSTEVSLDASAVAALLYKTARDKYKVGMAIEEGAFAAVKSCKSKEDDKVYLARVIKKSKVFGRDDKILQEIKIMRMLRNNNLMGVVDYWETSNEHVMVMEPIEGGDLYDAILYCQHFSELDSRSCAHQLGLAMVYLHANMIVHRNIKPENIFLSLDHNRMWTLKLAGFSLAAIATEPLNLECGNEYYRAPEMTSGMGYGAKADVWSAGIITYVLLSGVMPFSRKKTKKKIKPSLSFPTVYWDNISPEAKDFVQHLLKVSPNERHSSSQLLQHPWLKMDTQPPPDLNLSEMLIKHLAEQANMKTAPVPILTVTALSHNRAHVLSDKKH